MGQYAPGSEGLLLPLVPYLTKDYVSEILINSPGELWVEELGLMTRKMAPSLTESHLLRLFQLIANENNQIISRERPLLSGQLYDGTRVQLLMPPTAKYPTMSVRRKVVKQKSLSEYQENQFYRYTQGCDIKESSFNGLANDDKNLVTLYHAGHWSKFIESAIQSKKNIVISGGTSSGKTTYLNACLSYIPIDTRIIVLEDTREIEAPHPNQVQLLTSKGDQGLAKVSMQDLVQSCLRLRPDRIIMGEIRGKEIMDFISACSTGHEGSLTTIHANNPRGAFMRMTQLYKLNNVPSMSDADILCELKEVIDIVIQLNKVGAERIASNIYYKYSAIEPSSNK